MAPRVIVAGFAAPALKTAVAEALATLAADRAVVDKNVFSPTDERVLLYTRLGEVVVAVDDEEGVLSRTEYFYHIRVLAVAEATVQEIAAAALDSLLGGGVTKFVSTRTPGCAPVSFLKAVLEGLAPDGGLFLPAGGLPPLPPATLRYLMSAAAPTSYPLVAQIVLEHLVDRAEVPAGLLKAMIDRAYAAAAWSKGHDCCPISDATFPEAVANGVSVFLSEQYHGPTSAFKDFALQLFPQWFDIAATMYTNGCDDEDAGPASNYLILAATSGDTGGAAISGFVRGSPGTRVMVLYPTKGVSPVQRTQMLSMHGGNVNVLGVDADFDFCQAAVKNIFGDVALKKRLAAEHQTELSSANSINWGRLLPQLVYYFANYGALVRRGKIVPGESIDVCVPTGNFGNILACYLGKSLGLPLNRLILASNSNDVLADFVQTGTYDVSGRALSLTASPSIDILRASNVERFLFLATGGDAETVRALMASLNGPEKRFTAPDAVIAELKAHFWAGRCDESSCRDAIRRTHGSCGTLIDPHTAVAMDVARQYVTAADCVGKRARCLLVASTAHWSKFPEPVAEALQVVDAAELKGNAASAADVRRLYASIIAAAAGAEVSAPLTAVFDSPSLLEHGPSVGADLDAVKAALLAFCASPQSA